MEDRDSKKEKKYSGIEAELRHYVFSDMCKPGDKFPSENVLADRYGVSRQTVRKALEGLEREGYIYAKHGSGRYVSERQLHRKQSGNIAVIMTYLSDYIFPKVISGIDEVLSANGYDLILKHTNNSRHGEIACLTELMDKDIDGIIIEPSKSNLYCRHTDLFEKLEQYAIPYVFIQGEYEAMADRPHVLLDDEKGSFLLTRHLIRLGHREIFGIFKSDDSQGQKRHNGYARALAQHRNGYGKTTCRVVHTSSMIEPWGNNHRGISWSFSYARNTQGGGTHREKEGLYVLVLYRFPGSVWGRGSAACRCTFRRDRRYAERIRHPALQGGLEAGAHHESADP